MRLQKQICESCNDYTKLVDLDNGIVIIEGDYYHDKINDKIVGFLCGLDYCNIEYTLIENSYSDVGCLCE